MQPFAHGTEEFFRYQLIKGQIAKELVKGLLETCQKYQVYSFGYESTISQLRYHVMQAIVQVLKKGFRKLTCAQCDEPAGYVSIQPYTTTVFKAYCDNCYITLT